MSADFLTAAVMAAAFGGPGRVVGSNDMHCWDDACEHKRWSLLAGDRAARPAGRVA